MPEGIQFDNPKALADRIRQKYPGAYKDKSDVDLSRAWLNKYPVYWKNINPASFASQGLWQPSSTGTKTESVSQGKQSRFGRGFERAAYATVESAPAIGATVGSIGGSLLGSPMVGGVALAGAGAELGEMYREKVMGEKPSARKIAGQGLVNAGLEFVGGTAAPIAIERMSARLGNRFMPKAWQSINNFIGLGASDLPKARRSVESAQEIAETVRSEVGIKPTLQGEVDAIEGARKAHDAATINLMDSPFGRTSNFHNLAKERGEALVRELKREGALSSQVKAIKLNVSSFTDNMPKNMTPRELLDTKRSIERQITTWDRSTANVRQRYLHGLYDDINLAIEKSLPKKEGEIFRQHNLIQTRLITAREAGMKKLLEGELKEVPGLATTIFRIGGGAAVGAIIGGTTGRSGRGAMEGAALGAGFGLYGGGSKIRGITASQLDAKSRDIIVKSIPKLASLAKSSPTAARALQVVQSYLGYEGPKTQQLRQTRQQQINQNNAQQQQNQ